jgi:hypothetical protein
MANVIIMPSSTSSIKVFETNQFQIISYDSPRGGVSVITEKGDVTASFLVVQHARPSDSGTYSCSPSVGETVSVNVHVLRGQSHLSRTLSDFNCLQRKSLKILHLLNSFES